MYVFLLRIIDTYFFGLCILFFFWIKYLPKKVPTPPKRILIIRLWALWSSLLTYPLIQEVRRTFPDATIDLLASNRNIAVFKNQGIFDAIYNIFSWKGVWHTFKNAKKYDIVIDAEDYFHVSTLVSLWTGKQTIGYGNLRIRSLGYTNPVLYNDSQHAVLTFLDLLSPLHIPYTHPPCIGKFQHNITSDSTIDSLLALSSDSICLHTWWAETSPDRFWNQENWVTLIEQIRIHIPHAHIFLTGTHLEKHGIDTIIWSLSQDEKVHVHSLCGQCNLNQLAYFLERCSVTVSNDTGVMHLSAAMETPTIGLFGPNIPERFWPYPSSKHIALYKWDYRPTINVHLREFKTDTVWFVNYITPKEVLDAIQKIIPSSSA